MNEGHLQFLSSPEWAQLLRENLLPWIEAVGDIGSDVLEIGPGPGLTTDLLRERAGHLTAIERDPELAGRLRERLAGTNVEVLCADAAASGLPAGGFSAVTCFSMLHHMPGPEHQDRLFSEVHRVLRPGGTFLGVDALDLDFIRQGHVDDTFVPVDPASLPERLEAAGLRGVGVFEADYEFRFVAGKPGRGRSPRVLVADDTAALRQSQADVLRFAGYEVSEAGSEEEAVDVLGRDDVDLAVLDLGFDHWGLRVLDRAAVTVPVILVSGTGEVPPDDARVSMFLVKPVSPIELLAAITSHVGRAGATG